jgi:hypothetical protein
LTRRLPPKHAPQLGELLSIPYCVRQDLADEDITTELERMAKNDVVLLDGIVEQRLKDRNPSDENDEVFEYLALEQILKDVDPSKEEIESGWVDGRDDGGIDGFFTIINGHVLVDLDNFAWPKSNASIDVYIITCKHHDTFLQAPINTMIASTQELFDLGREERVLSRRYSAELLEARNLFHQAYRKLSSVRSELNIRIYYASRGETGNLGNSVTTHAEQLTHQVNDLFSAATVSFTFVGAAELLVLYRRVRTFSLELKFSECLSGRSDGYALLTPLGEYFRFVTDGSGSLRRYLFDSNVRDYLGSTGVNEDILESLSSGGGPEFWWLNNGVTVLATGATIVGKTIHLQNIQIVNGLQTTESLFQYFTQAGKGDDPRAVLVKIIVSEDSAIRDRIIRATNNQNSVELAALHATDKIQRDIEAILERNDWYYERRKNYYRNIGKPIARFVTPLYVASGFVALVMKNPAVAARLKNRFMRDPISYNAVFSENTDIHIWPAIVGITKKVEYELDAIREKTGELGDRFLAKWRGLASLLVVARLTGTFAFSVEGLIGLDSTRITRDLVESVWADIRPPKEQKTRIFRNEPAVRRCCELVASRYGITNLEQVGIRVIPTEGSQRDHRPSRKPYTGEISEEFLQSVNDALPPQPWKLGLHATIAEKIGGSRGKIRAAIQELIARGKWHQQLDGVVYDKDGTVIARDTERDTDRSKRPGE